MAVRYLPGCETCIATSAGRRDVRASVRDVTSQSVRPFRDPAAMADGAGQRRSRCCPDSCSCDRCGYREGGCLSCRSGASCSWRELNWWHLPFCSIWYPLLFGCNRTTANRTSTKWSYLVVTGVTFESKRRLRSFQSSYTYACTHNDEYHKPQAEQIRRQPWHTRQPVPCMSRTCGT